MTTIAGKVIQKYAAPPAAISTENPDVGTAVPPNAGSVTIELDNVNGFGTIVLPVATQGDLDKYTVGQAVTITVS